MTPQHPAIRRASPVSPQTRSRAFGATSKGDRLHMSDQTAQSARGARGVWGDGIPPGSGGSGGSSPRASTISRRGLLRTAGASAAVVGGGGLLEACSSNIKGASGGSTSTTGGGGGTKDIVIGFIHPLTGALAGFGSSDNWIMTKIAQTPQYKNGFKIGGKTYQVTVK